MKERSGLRPRRPILSPCRRQGLRKSWKSALWDLPQIWQSQIITHFLKIGSLKEQLELKKIEYEITLLEAKTNAIKAQEEQDKKYEEVIKAIASYTGKDDEWEEVPYDWNE